MSHPPSCPQIILIVGARRSPRCWVVCWSLGLLFAPRPSPSPRDSGCRASPGQAWEPHAVCSGSVWWLRLSGFFFFFSSLLRYNSYTRQFTHFKGATPRLLVYSRVRSHHHAHFKTPSSPREETLHLLRLPLQPSATTRLLPSSGLPVSGATEVAVLSEQLRPWSPGGLPFWRILFRGLDTPRGFTHSPVGGVWVAFGRFPCLAVIAKAPAVSRRERIFTGRVCTSLGCVPGWRCRVTCFHPLPVGGGASLRKGGASDYAHDSELGHTARCPCLRFPGPQ